MSLVKASTYIAPAPVFEMSDSLYSKVLTPVASVETYLQQIAQSLLNYPQNFCNPHWTAYLTSNNAAGWITSMEQTATYRLSVYPMLQTDPIELGMKYGNLIVNMLQDIDSGGYGGTAGISVWDFWISIQ